MENVKKNLRSVLLSKAGGVPLKNVERDYKSLVGDRLNWKQFGFGSFEAFLNTIPDVVKVAIRKDEMYAFGVAENMSYINPTARKAQFRDNQPKNRTYSRDTAMQPKNETSSDSPFEDQGSSVLVPAGRDYPRCDTGQMTVYFGSLPTNTTKEALNSLLNGYPVMDIKISRQQSFTNAWVITSKDSGQSMCSKLNGQQFGDRKLRVEPARGKSLAEKRGVPTQPQLSTRDSSGRSSSASVNSNGNASSLKTQSSTDNSAIESRHSADTWNKQNGVVEPRLRRGLLPDPCPEQRSLPHIANSNAVLARETSAFNYDFTRPFGSKDSTNVSGFQCNDRLDYGRRNSDLLLNSNSEPPPLIERDDWEEFENGTSSEYFNVQKDFSRETRDEPPPLFSRGDCERLQLKNENSSSASYPLNAALNDKEHSSRNPYEGDTFSLYVKNIPLGTTMGELLQLFKNAVKIVELPGQSCFAVFKSFQEVEDASKRPWMIRGMPIFVDVASRHKSEPGYDADDHSVDLCSRYENLTCTIGSNNERKVQLCVEKLPKENKSIDCRSQKASSSDVQENFQHRSVPVADMPPLISKADHTNSRQPASSDVIPPLLSAFDLSKIRENQPPLSQKALMLTKLCNSEFTERDFPAAVPNNAYSKRPGGTFNSAQETQKTESSKQLHNPSDLDSADWNGGLSKQMHYESNSRGYFPKSSSDLPSGKQGNSLETQGSPEICDQKVVSVLKPQDRPDSRAEFQPLLDAGKNGGLDDPSCAASLSSQLSMATMSSQSALSMQPMKPIPDEMRLKELQRMLMDTFPGDTLPTSYLLPEVIDVIIICVVPGFENGFFWGQVASGPFESELQRMYELIPRIEEMSGSLTLASGALRRGTAKYGEDWCRVWIKLRGETTSTCFFIDFGNFETVSNKDIYELPEEFWKVRPTALPFRVLDSGKWNISERVNKRVAAKVNKKCQRGCIFEIFDLQVQS